MQSASQAAEGHCLLVPPLHACVQTSLLPCSSKAAILVLVRAIRIRRSLSESWEMSSSRAGNAL